MIYLFIVAKRYLEGKYRPINYTKYRGDPTKVFYRSSWELKFMQWCDKTPSIIEWNSECIVIPYYDPVQRKWRRYFPDFYLKVRDINGRIVQHLVEVKPRRQIDGPKRRTGTATRNKTYITEVNTFATNTAKWEAASEFCKDRKWEWTLVDEHDLQIRFFGRKSKR